MLARRTGISVKARRWGRKQRPTRVRLCDLAVDPFDRLVFVLFGDAMQVKSAVELAIDDVRAIAIGTGPWTYTTVGRILAASSRVDRTPAFAAVNLSMLDGGPS
jgi:hypothetical protein